jgi:hypothetical protein
MEKKDELEQLTAHIKRLERLAEDIRGRDIYPVAFFSEAFDVTNRMQALLHRMEVSELALFERQMKEHEAQIRTLGLLWEPETLPSDKPAPEPPSDPAPLPQELPPPPATERPAAPGPLPSTPPPPARGTGKQEERLNETIEKNRLADLRKAFTLNDRFRFCRDLFGKDEDLMSRTLAELNVKDSCESSIAYLREQFNWDFEDGTVAEFVAVLEKRFS